MAGQKVFLASDLHLGAPNPAASREREIHFVNWLDQVSPDMAELILLGDVFDFWFEWKRAVPKGYVRLLGKLAQLTDQGVHVHIFTGNHDLWYKDYFEQEVGARVYHGPITREWFGKTWYLAHGDGLGPGDHGYKLMKKVFTFGPSKWLFARFHPNFSIGLARFVSSLSRHHQYHDIFAPETRHLGDREFLYQHARDLIQQRPEIDRFVFGHRHILVDEELAPDKRIYILGDWIQYFSYLEIGPEGHHLDIVPVPEMQVNEGVVQD